MISSDGIRGYNDMIILCLILEKPSYGYEISKAIKERTNEQYSMKETTLYSAFSRLEKSGYIESFFGTETNGKRRTYYRITDLGKTYYTQKCEEWKLTQEVVNQFCKEDFFSFNQK
ncbi:MAG: PadR family transcriptional regulator [Lachnospiraceae bacterium]